MAKTTKTTSEPQSGRKLLQVKYHRVKFRQKSPDRQIEYDSDAPAGRLPLEAQGYHGLKDNSFQFWISGDNQILEMVGFEQFVERCLKDVAPQRMQQVRGILASTSGADGIANFVDDSIGLLPSTQVRVGDVWSRARSIHQPIPMHITTKYALRSLTPQGAEVDILGTITPSASDLPSLVPTEDVHVTVQRGHCFGSCLIDRRTGLPLSSKVEQDMQMHVQLPGNINFDQQKMTVTTIRAFTDGPGQPMAIDIEATANGEPRAFDARGPITQTSARK